MVALRVYCTNCSLAFVQDGRTYTYRCHLCSKDNKYTTTFTKIHSLNTMFQII